MTVEEFSNYVVEYLNLKDDWDKRHNPFILVRMLYIKYRLGRCFEYV